MFNQSKPSSVVSPSILLSNSIRKANEPKAIEPSETVYAKGDSAASSHYWREEDKKVISNIQEISGPQVILPNKQTIGITSQGALPLSALLSDRAKKASILPGLKSASLISIGQLCDDGCDVLLNNKKLLAIKEHKIILEGTRNYSDGLWDIPVYKNTIASDTYALPNIHPGMYPATKVQSAHSTIALRSKNRI